MNHNNDRNCDHCGQSHSQGLAYCANIAGQELAMCCAGCLAVARLIANSGESTRGVKPGNDGPAPGC